MRQTITLLAICLSLFLSCKSEQQVSDKSSDKSTDKPAVGTAIKMNNLDSGTYSGYEEAQQFLITNEKDWANTWKLLNRNKSPQPEMPAVDFSKQSVVAVFLGMKGSGGFGIRIVETLLSGETLNVKVVQSKPGKNCMSTAAMTQPYHLVTVDKAAIKKAAFSVEEKINDCE